MHRPVHISHHHRSLVSYQDLVEDILHFLGVVPQLILELRIVGELAHIISSGLSFATVT